MSDRSVRADVDRQRRGAELHPVGVDRARHVDAIVDEEERAGASRRLAEPHGERVELAAGESLSRSCTAGSPASSARATTSTSGRPPVACRSVTRRSFGTGRIVLCVAAMSFRSTSPRPSDPREGTPLRRGAHLSRPRPLLDRGDDGRARRCARLMGEAKAAGLWALGHPNETRRRRAAVPRLRLRQRGRRPRGARDGRARHALAAGLDHAEPVRVAGVARSLPPAAGRGRGVPELRDDRARRRQLRSDAAPDARRPRRRPLGDQRPQVVHDRRRTSPPTRRSWCATEPDAPRARGVQHDRRARPTRPATRIVRDVPVHGHATAATARSRTTTCACRARTCSASAAPGFLIAQQRLGPGPHLPLHALARPGAARLRPDVRARQRAHRLRPAARRQAVRSSRWSSTPPPRSRRAGCSRSTPRTRSISGDPARVEIGIIKVVGAQMLHNAIDRAIQVFGAKGVTRRHAARAHVPPRALRPHLRRARRGASRDGCAPAPARLRDGRPIRLRPGNPSRWVRCPR